MTEPTDDELDRAERIRKLRTGGARSRSQEIRDQRREAADGAHDRGDEEPPADGRDGDAAGDGASPAADEALEEEERVDVVELADDLPPDGSLFVVPVGPELRRSFNTVAEQLHLRYGFRFDRELDTERHLRPLALYLGVKTLEDADVDVVKELLDSVDELEAPADDDG